jgi:UDP-N-acetylmuramoylalanine--D-glutamate ligase
LSAERRLYVIEMSSFQLELFHSSKGAVSGLLNISPDHLDRYPDIDDYHAAKQRIFKDAACAVVNRQDPLTYPQADDNLSIISFGTDAPNGDNFGLLTENGETWLVGGGEQLMLQSQLAMQGRHNIANALAALALGRSAGLPMAAMLATLQEFKGLPHRCEKIASIDEVLYIDDSKATNVGAACAAIDGFSSATEKNIVLIAGGRTKGQDFSDLVVRAAASVRLCVLIGEAAQELAKLLDGQVTTHVCDNLSAAVGVAHARAHPGDVVLLSPACASFDMFADFADRGRCFRTAVEAINVRLADSEAP